jgi:hypothetical protein
MSDKGSLTGVIVLAKCEGRRHHHHLTPSTTLRLHRFPPWSRCINMLQESKVPPRIQNSRSHIPGI